MFPEKTRVEKLIGDKSSTLAVDVSFLSATLGSKKSEFGKSWESCKVLRAWRFHHDKTLEKLDEEITSLIPVHILLCCTVHWT